MVRALPHLLAAYLVLVGPWAGRFRYRRLQQQILAGVSNARCRFYRRAVTRQAVLTTVGLLIVLLGHIPANWVGLVSPRSWAQTSETLCILLIAILVSAAAFRYRGDKQFSRLQKMVGALLPVTRTERWWFAGVGIGAGISEELLFRGFLLYYVWAWFPGLDWWARIGVASLVFGLCHLYQGFTGVLLTAAMGFCFGMLYLTSGSLLTPMLIHAAVDVRILALLRPDRVRSLQQTSATAHDAPELSAQY
jgi:uncharacterized protein